MQARTLALLLKLYPAEPEIMGLTALMLLQHARARARIAGDGSIVLLEDQDRRLWDRVMIEEGTGLIDGAMHQRRTGPYQLQAAIAALHALAESPAATDWRQILQLYDQLLSIARSPVVALNRAVAVAEVEGTSAALALLERLELDDYHLFHAIRADLLRRAGRNDEAALAYTAALARTSNAREREFLQRSRQALARA